MKIAFTVNPGSGPVKGATEEIAGANIRAFAVDLRARGVEVRSLRRRAKSDYGEGRYAFELDLSFEEWKSTVEVQMPGIPLESVRYLGRDDQDIWNFPRLYVNDSSWVWMYAVDVSVPSVEDAK